MPSRITRTRTGLFAQRQGCLTCRARRTKCDEHKPRCGNCTRLGLECDWSTVTRVPLRQHAAAGPSVQRKSRATACERCQRDKARCSKGTGICERCALTGFDCRRGPSGGGDPHKTSSQEGFPSQAEIVRLFDAFFKLDLSWYPLTYLHRESLQESLLYKSPPSSIILLMCALALFVSSPTSSDRKRADSWVDHVKKDIVLFKISEGFSTAGLATILLIKTYDERTGRMGGPWLWTAVATRMAYGLGLNTDWDPQGRRGEGEKEIGRRLMWSCFMSDRLIGAGTAALSLCPTASLELQLPRDDQSLDIPGLVLPTLEDAYHGRNLEALATHGSYSSFLVWFMEIRHQVLAYTKSLSRLTIGVLTPWSVGSPYLHILQQLNLSWTTLSRRFGDSPTDKSVTALRVWCHQAHCDLHRLAMPGFSESLPLSLLETAPDSWVSDTRQACLQHALRIYEILQECVDIGPEAVPKNPSIIVSIYETMRIQLQFISMSEGEIPADLRQTLIRNFNLGLLLVGQLSHLNSTTMRYAQIVHSMLIKHGVPINNAEAAETPAEHQTPGLSQMHHLRLIQPSTQLEQLPFPKTDRNPKPIPSSPDILLGQPGPIPGPSYRMENLFGGDEVQVPPTFFSSTAAGANVPDLWGDAEDPFVSALLWNMNQWTAGAG